ncbi:MAG: cytochrome b [Sideroxydans sp.]|nr:cytochrome b [Sideroxydans sp.]
MTNRYTRTAVSLHWLIALLILAAFPLGLYMHDLPLSPYKLRLYSYHKWIGVTVFLLAVFRIYWRVTHRPPPLPDSMPRWERIAAESVHWLLYVLLLLVPISGWLMSSAKGFQTVWFGVLPLPDLVGKDKALGELLQQVHELFNYTLFGVLAGHIGAALKHQFIERDDILSRMVPWLRKSS